MYFLLGRTLKILRKILLVLFSVLLVVVVLINLVPVQNFVAQQTVKYLTRKLDTRIELDRVALKLPNRAQLKGFFVADQQGDTLLYARAAEFRIGWSLFKNRWIVNHLKLEGGTVYLNRTENGPAWNLQFIIDAFSPQQPRERKAEPVDFRVNRVVLENMRFQMLDAWNGSDMEASVEELNIRVKELNVQQRLLRVGSIKADELFYRLRSYTGGRPASSRVRPGEVVDTTAFNPENWRFFVDALDIEKSRFQLDNMQPRLPAGQFDPGHMDISGISIRVRDGRIHGDTIRAELRHLAAKDHSGVEIVKMNADVTVSPNISECANLYLQTGNSVLGDYYAMQYERFPDFLDYIDKVTMKGSLRGAEIGIQDIAYFAPALSRFKLLSVEASGEALGTVSRLNAKGMDLFDGYTRLTGNLSLVGLPDIRQTFIDFNHGSIATNGLAALMYVPQLREQQAVDVQAIKWLDFKGDFTGYLSDFVAYGALSTNLGELQADINMKLSENAAPAYSGLLSASAFDLGKLFYQPNLGTATFSGEVAGAGFSFAELNTSAELDIRALNWNDYEYRNIGVNGRFEAKAFEGELQARDPNLDMDFEGRIDLSEALPHYDFQANVRYFNASALQFTDKAIRGSAHLKLDVRGNTIDDFLGSAYVFDIDIVQDSTRLNLDSMQLLSAVEPDGKKLLSFTTNNIRGTVRGHFALLELPQAFQYFLSYYLPGYIRPPAAGFDDSQHFDFEVLAEEPDNLLPLFVPGLTLGPASQLVGSLDLRKQELLFKAAVPFLKWQNFSVQQIRVEGTGDNRGLDLTVNTDALLNGKRAMMHALQFESSLSGGAADFTLSTSSDKTLGDALISGEALARNDSFFVQLLPSEFFLNNEKWEVPGNNRFEFAPDHFLVDNLIIRSGLQSIEVNAAEGDPVANNLSVQLRQVSIAPLNGFLESEKNSFDGYLTGSITGRNLMQEPAFHFELNSGTILINADTFGKLQLEGSYDLREKVLHFEQSELAYNADSKLIVMGDFGLSNKRSKDIEAAVVFRDARVRWLKPFLDGYIGDLSGVVDGQVHIRGSFSKPETRGMLVLKALQFRPEITGVPYQIQHAVVRVEDGAFEMDELRIYDEAGNRGLLSGVVEHQGFRNFHLRLRFESDKIKALKLNAYQNENFYGDIDAKVQMRVTGPWSNLDMTVFASPHKNGRLIIPIQSGGDLGQYNYIGFKDYGDSSRAYLPQRSNRFNFRLDAIVTPDLETTILLDAAAGDQIWAKGSGNIVMEIPSGGEMKMNGNYIIDEGTYDFTFQQLDVLNYRRRFSINPGSVIKWNGDVVDADLDVKGYATIRARLYDLIQSDLDRLSLSPDELGDARVKQDVRVLLNMTGSLYEPDIQFQLELVEGRSIGTYAYQKLQRINSNERELLNQVAALLLLEQFIPPEGINNSAISAGTINNMSELLSTAASSQITNFANKILGMDDLYVGVRYKNYSLSNANVTQQAINYYNRNEAGIQVRKNFLDNRLVVEVGGVYDWGRTSGNNQVTSNLAGDFRVQYLLTEDGRIRLHIFRNSNYDPISLRDIARQGVGIGYRKSFNVLSDFFGGNQPEVPTRVIPAANTVPTADTGSSPALNGRKVDSTEQARRPEPISGS